MAALPTLTCKQISSGYGWAPVNYQFNTVQIMNNGQPFSYTYCDPDYSTFLPTRVPDAAMNADEFATLWPLLCGLLVAGFIIRSLLRAF